MPRADKNLKTRKSVLPKLGRNEKHLLEAISNAPKFPSTLVGLKKDHKK